MTPTSFSRNVSLIFVLATILPKYVYEGRRCNWGTPYRNGPKVCACISNLKSDDTPGGVLWNKMIEWNKDNRGRKNSVCLICGKNFRRQNVMYPSKGTAYHSGCLYA